MRSIRAPDGVCLCIKSDTPREKPSWRESSTQTTAGSARLRDAGSSCGPGSAPFPPCPMRPPAPAEAARPTHADAGCQEIQPGACSPSARRAKEQFRAGANVAAVEKGEDGEAPHFYCSRYFTASSISRSDSEYGARSTPRSVKMAVTYFAGVTSNAGLQIPTPCGVSCLPPWCVTS